MELELQVAVNCRGVLRIEPLVLWKSSSPQIQFTLKLLNLV